MILSASRINTTKYKQVSVFRSPRLPRSHQLLNSLGHYNNTFTLLNKNTSLASLTTESPALKFTRTLQPTPFLLSQQEQSINPAIQQIPKPKEGARRKDASKLEESELLGINTLEFLPLKPENPAIIICKLEILKSCVLCILCIECELCVGSCFDSCRL